MRQPNAQYNVAAPDSLPIKLAGQARRLMFQKFLSEFNPSPADSILDVGATSDQSYESSNYLEAWYPNKDKVVAVGIDDASHLKRKYPGIEFVCADGRRLPFISDCFDYVHSSAVLEHVGGQDGQLEFVRELCRVARKGVFLTTPNRWYPMEFHTVLPLLHWLPKTSYRKLLSRMGYGFYADETNLNLIGKRDLHKLLRGLPADYTYKVATIWFLGGPTNLIATIRKQRP